VERKAEHGTFVVERTYDAPPPRVFGAWADPDAKSRWFAGPDEWKHGDHEMDFHVGGRERSSGGPPDGPIYTFDARYEDIVPNERIVYTYAMYEDETRISVSLATVELAPAGESTRLVFTEQAVFLDGLETAASREGGTRSLLENLAAELERQPAEA
jgi:uncharacterized protein YndB with AHSA1/START domain